jgi:cell division GTPase FtsZ
MNRKEAIKGLATIGIIATLPSLVKLTNKKKNIHFIGLGGAGSKAMGHIYEHGTSAIYSYITDVEHYKSNYNSKHKQCWFFGCESVLFLLNL